MHIWDRLSFLLQDSCQTMARQPKLPRIYRLQRSQCNWYINLNFNHCIPCTFLCRNILLLYKIIKIELTWALLKEVAEIFDRRIIVHNRLSRTNGSWLTALTSSDYVTGSAVLPTILALSCNRVVNIGMVRSLAITHTKRKAGWDSCSGSQRIVIGLILK